MVEQRTHFEIGERAALSKTITNEDICTFAKISLDENPLHLDEEYAKSSYFGGRIAHGMLVAALISAVLGTQLPGPGSVYLSQLLRFTAPVFPGDTLTARVEVTEWDAAKGYVTLLTDVVNQNDERVVTGEARLIMSRFLEAR